MERSEVSPWYWLSVHAHLRLLARRCGHRRDLHSSVSMVLRTLLEAA